MIVYHRTHSDRAESILASGFQDGRGNYLTAQEHSGVWLSDRPLDANEGADGDTLLALEIPESDLLPCEWVQEPSFGYREFLLPAETVNRHGPPRIVSEDEEEEFYQAHPLRLP